MKTRSLVLTFAFTLLCGLTLPAQKPAAAPQPSPESRKLGVFVGTWKDELEVKASPFGPGGKMNLTETCNWFTGGFSLVCRTDTTGFMGKIKTLTLFNYDPQEKVYTFYELNSMGAGDLQKGVVDGNTWTWTRASKIAGKLVRERSTLILATPDTASVVTEFSVDGGPWLTVMELKGTRVK